MKRTAVIGLLCSCTAFGADAVVVKPRRVIVVVRPRYEAADLAGNVIGAAIAQWMIQRQNRAVYGSCDAVFDSNCHMASAPAPVRDVALAPTQMQFADPNATGTRGLEAHYTIYSSQPGSEIFVDLKPMGVTSDLPFSIDLPSGTRYIVVKHAGFADVKANVEAQPGENKPVWADFK